MTPLRWVLVGVAATLLVLTGIVLGFSYAPPTDCTPHAVFVGNTVLEFCI